MKIERGYPIYTVTPKAENAIVKGHPWVYDAEILNIEGEIDNGGLVDVVSKKGRYLGTGFLSPALQDPGAAHLPERQRPL